MEILIPAIVMFLVMFGIARFMKTVNDVREEQIAELSDKISKIVHVVKEERIEDQIYWYDEHSNEFLAQGHDEDTIISILKSRFPKHHFLFMNDREEIVERIVHPLWKREPINMEQ